MQKKGKSNNSVKVKDQFDTINVINKTPLPSKSIFFFFIHVTAQGKLKEC